MDRQNAAMRRDCMAEELRLGTSIVSPFSIIQRSLNAYIAYVKAILLLLATRKPSYYWPQKVICSFLQGEAKNRNTFIGCVGWCHAMQCSDEGEREIHSDFECILVP